MRVYLTDSGRKREEETQSRLRNADAIVMRDVTPEESETLRRILLKIRRSLAENEDSIDPHMRRSINEENQ